MGSEHHQVTFEDAWQLWEEVENATGSSVAVTLRRPVAREGRPRYPALLGATATRREGKSDKERTEWVQIGGTRGARTVPAALIRALTALAARLEEATELRAEQAAF